MTHDDTQDPTRADPVGPRDAEGNAGWNEPVPDAPETLEGAVRRPGDPQNGGPERQG